jgi:hypothetical protein
MKLINKLFIIALVLGFAMSCENTELDLLDNPNAVTPENASLNDLYNSVQLQFRNTYNSAQGTPGAVSRMYHAGAFTYQASVTDATFNGLWNTAYSQLFPDVDALITLAEGSGFDIHAGSAKIMKAYTLMVLADLFGDVPNSEALQGTDIISPAADPGSAVYASAIALLDEAIAQMGSTNAAAPSYDSFFGGSTTGWIKFANTLKLRAALNTGDASTINSLVSGGNIITSAADDATFKYGSTRTNPNSRHPYYNNHYEIGDGDYLSTFYMWLFVGDLENVAGNDIADPRARYYFYRKVEDASAQDATTYGCNNSVLPDQNAAPAHWESVDPELPYCVVPGTGYSGRDHLNGQGIPPDGPIRTSYGLYPGGGQFDDNTFEDTRQGGSSGGLGQGVLPVMISPVVDLMRAEAALTLGTNDDARAMLESGIRASMAKAESFEALVSGTMSTELVLRDGSAGTVKDLYGITPARVDAYVADVLAVYDAADADTKLDIVVKELFKAAWGNGLEAYNAYRRTGKPGNMQPGLEADFGTFPRSMLLPAVHVTRNANATQRSFSDRVFWDDGSTNLY